MPLTCNGGNKFITVLNIGPGVGTYIVTPAHVAIHERDNAMSFACWRSEPNRILCVLNASAVPSGAIYRQGTLPVLSLTSIWLRQEEQRAPWQKRSSCKSGLEDLM